MTATSPFPSATTAEWRDWRWQQRHVLTTAAEIGEVVRLSEEELRGLTLAEGRFRVAITPYYASLMDPEDPSCPVRMQAIPWVRSRAGRCRRSCTATAIASCSWRVIVARSTVATARAGG